MGHYSGSYEFQEFERDKAERKEINRLLRKAKALHEAVKEEDALCTLVPERFVDSLEDLVNWLTVNCPPEPKR
jgi:hypothetical protein